MAKNDVLYNINRKKKQNSISGRAAALLGALLALLLFAGFARAEETNVPSPEPPAGYKTDRPTPVPTEAPPETVIDHINYPRVMPDFAFPEGSKLLEIWFPNIREADYALLQYDGENCLIDCGDERAAARGALLLRQLGVGKIDVIYNSHPHHDHIDGLALTDDTARVGMVRVCFRPALTASGLNMLQTAEERGIPVAEYRDGDVFTMGDGAVTLHFFMNIDPLLDMNNQSAQTLVAYGERRMLFTADMEKPGQEEIVQHVDEELLKCDIMKYPHHGKSEMKPVFFDKANPKLVVVTSSEGRGDLGQSFLVNRRTPAVYTGASGRFIHLVTDGKYWLCEYVPITVK